MAREHDRKRLLEDIRREVAYTRSYIGIDHLSDAVMAAMAAVPREHFVPDELWDYAFENGPLPIGHGQTISQPYIVALMTELLHIGPESTVLEVGTGSGYQTAVLAQIARKVYSIEIVEPLGREAAQRLQSLGYRNIETRIGDGYDGWIDHAPYDGIIVTAAAPTIPPPLIAQLKPTARLVIPVGEPYSGQSLIVVEKGDDGHFTHRHVLPVAFVPLTRKRGQD